ncbi:MAG: ribose-5-phosphate isomerase RpiA [Pseudomonadota bacterium]|nr:ribose-5-phosphate isomerase RpiA [Pseudomonadota bacterium]
MSQNHLKHIAAEAALAYLSNIEIIGIGTGTTVNFLIDLIGKNRKKIKAAVASSIVSAEKLKQQGIKVIDLDSVSELPIYVDGADEINPRLQMIKGGGGALTREKILASASQKFICIADHSKLVERLGSFPLPVEVIPMARNYVTRKISALGGQPMTRKGITDNGNIIIDIHNLNIQNPSELEAEINQIAGVVCCGLFTQRPADILLLATETGVKTLFPRNQS